MPKPTSLPRHKTLGARTWRDDYPDEIEVSVVIAEDTGKAFVQVTAQAVFLTADQVRDVRRHLDYCRGVADALNYQRGKGSYPTPQEGSDD